MVGVGSPDTREDDVLRGECALAKVQLEERLVVCCRSAHSETKACRVVASLGPAKYGLCNGVTGDPCKIAVNGFDSHTVHHSVLVEIRTRQAVSTKYTGRPTVRRKRHVKSNEEKRQFYERVAEILNIEHDYHDPSRKRTRWNNRRLGNGRFPGFGLVQCFGSTVRVVSKAGTRMFGTYEEVYDYLQTVVAKAE